MDFLRPLAPDCQVRTEVKQQPGFPRPFQRRAIKVTRSAASRKRYLLVMMVMMLMMVMMVMMVMKDEMSPEHLLDQIIHEDLLLFTG